MMDFARNEPSISINQVYLEVFPEECLIRNLFLPLMSLYDLATTDACSLAEAAALRNALYDSELLDRLQAMASLRGILGDSCGYSDSDTERMIRRQPIVLQRCQDDPEYQRQHVGITQSYWIQHLS